MGSRIITAFAAVTLVATGLPAQAPPGGTPAPAADLIVNMRDVEIAAVAEQISRITGRTLILDPSVSGKVNVTSAEPLTRDGVWELFRSVLRVHGFAAVRSGRAWRIIPQANAIRDPGSNAGRGGGGQEVVTRLIRLQNLASDQAVRVFRPLVASFGTIEALPSPNAIVVTDYAENVRRIERLAQSLDRGGGASFDTITLRHATARDVAAAIQGIFGDAAGGARVVADERSNVVIVRGEARAIAEARRIARAVDQPGGGTPVTRVFRLSNADAETVTGVLRGLMGEGQAATNPVARSLGGNRLTAAFGNRPNAAIGQSVGGINGVNGTGLLGAGVIGSGSTLGQSTSGLATLPAQGGGDAASSESAQGFSTPELTVQPAPELNAVVVRGTPTAIAGVESLITELDVRRPQVIIEAAIVEITGDDAEALGIQLGIGAAAAGGINGAATSFTNLGLPLRSVLSVLGVPAAAGLLADGLTANVGSRNDFSILVQALGQSSKANLLSTPSLTTLDNSPAEFVVGQNVPFRTGSFATDGNTLAPFTTIERQDVGITLRVVPRVHEGDVVRLEVSQEVSSLVPGTLSGAADLITNRRAIQTTVLADNGETIVLGGLITDDRMDARTQVPVLGDIPVVGELFKSRRESRTKRTLFVFLRPTILRDRAAANAATQQKYARLRGAEVDLQNRPSLLLQPNSPRLTLEIQGLY